MNQHAQAIDHRVAARYGFGQQGGEAGHVNNVAHHSLRCQAVERQGQRALTVHALVGGVDQQGNVGQGLAALVPRQHLYLRAKVRSQGQGFVDAAVAQAYLRHAGVQQRCHDGACCAACADDQCRTCLSAPSGLRFAQALQKAVGVGVSACQAAIGFHHHGVDRAYALGQRLHPVDDRQGRDLVRNRQIASGKAQLGQAAQGVCQIFGAHRQLHIGAAQTSLGNPMPMDQRRARMRHRPAHDAGEDVGPCACRGLFSHGFTACR